MYSLILGVQELYSLPKWQLIEEIKNCNTVLKLKYPRNHYFHNNNNKAFSEQELSDFFSAIRLPLQSRLYLAFHLMRDLGLRPIELVCLQEKDFLEHEGVLRVVNTKCGGIVDFLVLKAELVGLLKQYILRHKKQIVLHNGFLFFSRSWQAKELHISPCVLRNHFDKIRKKADLRAGLSCYSFRHWFANRVYRITNHDAKLTQAAMRHTSFETTGRYYLHADREELNKTILAV